MSQESSPASGKADSVDNDCHGEVLVGCIEGNGGELICLQGVDGMDLPGQGFNRAEGSWSCGVVNGVTLVPIYLVVNVESGQIGSSLMSLPPDQKMPCKREPIHHLEYKFRSAQFPEITVQKQEHDVTVNQQTESDQ